MPATQAKPPHQKHWFVNKQLTAPGFVHGAGGNQSVRSTIAHRPPEATRGKEMGVARREILEGEELAGRRNVGERGVWCSHGV